MSYDEELPAWIAALAAGVACLAYAWWLAWTFDTRFTKRQT